ncbi:MAG: hypothetical protein AABZ06_08435 [Bdellovibrionota bacterium]
MYSKYIDPVIEEFTTGDYYREVYTARKEYFEKAGVVYEDDPEFEHRMCIFMDWYLFDRDLPGVDLPPIRYYFRKHKNDFSSEEINIYKDFCATIHSIFRVKRFTWIKKSCVVTDLFSAKSYKVNDPEVTMGFTKGDIFEARLIPFRGTYEFSRGFCFHPIEIESFILREVKKIRSQDKKIQTKLIHQLAAMKLKHLRFQHIDISHIYKFDSRF